MFKQWNPYQPLRQNSCGTCGHSGAMLQTNSSYSTQLNSSLLKPLRLSCVVFCIDSANHSGPRINANSQHPAKQLFIGKTAHIIANNQQHHQCTDSITAIAELHFY